MEDNEINYLKLQNLMLQAENRRLKMELENIKGGFISIDLSTPFIEFTIDEKKFGELDDFKSKNSIYIPIKKKIEYAYRALTDKVKTYREIKLEYKNIVKENNFDFDNDYKHKILDTIIEQFKEQNNGKFL